MYKSLALDTLLNQLIMFYNFMSCFFEIHFNIILTSVPICSSNPFFQVTDQSFFMNYLACPPLHSTEWQGLYFISEKIRVNLCLNPSYRYSKGKCF